MAGRRQRRSATTLGRSRFRSFSSAERRRRRFLSRLLVRVVTSPLFLVPIAFLFRAVVFGTSAAASFVPTSTGESYCVALADRSRARRRLRRIRSYDCCGRSIGSDAAAAVRRFGRRRLGVDDDCDNDDVKILPIDKANDEFRRLLFLQHEGQLNKNRTATRRAVNKNCEDRDADAANATVLVQVEGYVTAVRSFGNSFAFLDIGCRRSIDSPVQVMLKRQAYGVDNSNCDVEGSNFDGIFRSMVPGVKVRVAGTVGPTRNPGEAVLVARKIQLVKWPRNPQHVRKLLSLLLQQSSTTPGRQLQRERNDGDGNGALVSLNEPIFDDHPIRNDRGNIEALRRGEDVNTTASSTTASSSSSSSSSSSLDDPLQVAAKMIVAQQEEDSEYPYEQLMQQRQQPAAVSDEHSTTTTWNSSSSISKKKNHNPATSSSSNYKGSPLLLPLAPVELQTPPPSAARNVVLDDDAVDFASGDHLLSIQETHQRIQRLSDSDWVAETNHSRVRISGWVQNRRRFRNNITILEIVDIFTSSSSLSTAPDEDGSTTKITIPHRVKCVLHPNSIKEEYDPGGILAPGSQVSLVGTLDRSVSSHGDQQEQQPVVVILWVNQARLLRATWRPATIRMILENAAASILEPSEAARALRISDTEMHRLVDATTDAVERQWAASEISNRLQNEASRTATVSEEQMNVLEKYERYLCGEKYPINAISHDTSAEDDEDPVAGGVVDDPVAGGVVDDRPGSRWQRKKLPQLRWILEEVRDICESHPEYPSRPIRILDVGGGRGLLANFLADSLPVEVKVIDISSKTVENGKMRSRRSDLANKVKYEACDASAVTFQPEEFDIVVALHACGALTDIALSHAVANQAAFVICPCCFRSNPQLRIHRTVAVQDWIGVSPDDYAALKTLAEVQGDQSLASRAMHAICALRSSAVERHSKQRVRAVIKTFPIAFSTRNFAIVGTRQ